MGNKTQILKPIDLSKKLRPYENKWVALSLDYKKVLGVGDTLEEAERKARKKSKEYIFLKLPPFNVYYIPIQY
jgi:hypothetical protein